MTKITEIANEFVGNLATNSNSDPAQAIKEIIMKLILIATELAYYLFLIGILISGAMYLFAGGDEDNIAKAKKNFVWVITGFAIAVFAFSITSFITSQLTGLDGLTATSNAFSAITAKIFSIVTMVAGAGFLLMLLFGGFRYMVSGGIEENTHKAKMQMVQSGIGLVLVIFSYSIGMLIINLITRI